jgi:hypothetical protein
METTVERIVIMPATVGGGAKISSLSRPFGVLSKHWHGTTVSAVAVAWTLAWPGVTGAIVGARNPAQIDDWRAAATLELSDADLDEIAEMIRYLDVGGGPAPEPLTSRPSDRPTEIRANRSEANRKQWIIGDRAPAAGRILSRFVRAARTNVCWLCAAESNFITEREGSVTMTAAAVVFFGGFL